MPKRRIPSFARRATPAKAGEVFLARHNEVKPGAAVQSDDPRLASVGGGETNTASNVGTDGVGVFKQKTGVDLEFKNINAASSKVTVTDDTGDDEIDIDVVDATTNQKGAVELATDGENASGVVVQGNDSRINVLTTKGDIYGYDTAPARVPVGTNGQGLMADSADAQGVSYKWFVGPLGVALTGSGRDGSISCGSGTVTHSTQSLLNYTTLDVGTGTYSHEANLNQIAIYAEAITGAGGTLQGVTGTSFSGTLNSGGAASGGGAAGGAGGRGAGAMFIYTKEITGSGTIKITNASPNGSNGNNATVATTTGNGANGGVANIAATIFGLTTTAWHGGSYQVISGGQSGGNGGASNSSAGIISNDAALDDAIWDWMAWLAPRPSDGSSTGDINGRARSFAARNGLGGAAGGRNTGAQGAGGGAGAATCLAAVHETLTNGGSGNAGAAGAAGAGGGGGGSGGSGGFLCIWTMSAASGWTFTAPGGNGGNGGNGFGNGGGGGEGCGGPGGMVLLFTPVASSATLSAPGGSKGSKGTGGTEGTVAGDAPAGYTRNVVLVAA